MSMTAAQFAERISNVAKNYETSYIWGVFGAPITEATVQSGLIRRTSQTDTPPRPGN